MQPTARPAPLLRRLRPAAAAALVVLATVGGGAFGPASAAASGDDVISECVAGALTDTHPLQDYQDALDALAADMAEYTPCIGEIRLARDRMLQRTTAGKGTAGGSGSGSAAAGGGRGGTTGFSAGAGGPAAPGATTGAADPDAAATAGAGESSPVDTTPTTPSEDPTAAGTSGDEFLALPLGGGDAGGSARPADGDVPLVPVVIALSLVALSAARGLIWWSRRPERIDGPDGLDQAAGTA